MGEGVCVGEPCRVVYVQGWLVKKNQKLDLVGGCKRAELCRVVYVQVWLDKKNQNLELVTSLKIVFELELVGKPKSLSSAWLGLT